MDRKAKFTQTSAPSSPLTQAEKEKFLALSSKVRELTLRIRDMEQRMELKDREIVVLSKRYLESIKIASVIPGVPPRQLKRRTWLPALDLPKLVDAAIPVSRRGKKLTKAEVLRSIQIKNSEYFEAAWYAENLGVRELAGLQAHEHYARYGNNGNISPGPNFDAMRYLLENPDVASAGANPLIHFEQFGRLEGRAAFPLRENATTSRNI